jgi:hypothetical protein
MKAKPTFLILTIAAALLGGCGKNEQPASPSADTGKAAATPEPQKAPEKAPEPAANNLAAAATNTAKGVSDLAAKPPEPATPTPVPAATTPAPASASLASLSQDQVLQGLQAALAKGLQQAIANLGHDGGFLTNVNVKIPMPEKLQKVESALRAMKQDKYADEFVATMNHAAEQAVPLAGAVFGDALKNMSIDDAKSILNGPTDAATQYFQKTTSTNLYAKFYPIVQEATKKTGVTAAYKNLMAKADVTKSLGSIGNALGGAVLDKDTMDVDAYVTDKTMDGLFKMVAEEEKQIRQNPAARTSDILQTVFGAIKK